MSKSSKFKEYLLIHLFVTPENSYEKRKKRILRSRLIRLCVGHISYGGQEKNFLLISTLWSFQFIENCWGNGNRCKERFETIIYCHPIYRFILRQELYHLYGNQKDIF